MKKITREYSMNLKLAGIDVSKIDIPKSMTLAGSIVTVFARDHDAAILAVKNVFGVGALSSVVRFNTNKNKKKRRVEQKATRGSVKNEKVETASELEAIVKKTKVKKCVDYRFRGVMFLNYGKSQILFD